VTYVADIKTRLWPSEYKGAQHSHSAGYWGYVTYTQKTICATIWLRKYGDLQDTKFLVFCPRETQHLLLCKIFTGCRYHTELTKLNKESERPYLKTRVMTLNNLFPQGFIKEITCSCPAKCF
jgi:hypothetical protein